MDRPANSISPHCSSFNPNNAIAAHPRQLELHQNMPTPKGPASEPIPPRQKHDVPDRHWITNLSRRKWKESETGNEREGARKEKKAKRNKGARYAARRPTCRCRPVSISGYYWPVWRLVLIYNVSCFITSTIFVTAQTEILYRVFGNSCPTCFWLNEKSRKIK